MILASCLASGFVRGRKWTVIALWVGLAVNLVGGLWYLQADLYTGKYTIVVMLSVWALGAGLVMPTATRLTFAGQDPKAVRQLAGVKVSLRFVMTILASFAAALVIQRGTDIGQDRLRQHVTRNNPAYRSGDVRASSSTSLRAVAIRRSQPSRPAASSANGSPTTRR